MNNDLINDKIYVYEVLSEEIPFILKQEWGFNFDSDLEKKLSIALIQHLNETTEIKERKIVNLQDNFLTWGFFNGKISFSINNHKAFIVKCALIILMCHTENTWINITLTALDTLLENAIGRSYSLVLLEDDLIRCTYLKIIKLSKNNSKIPVPFESINNYSEEGFCPFLNIKCDKRHMENNRCLSRINLKENLNCLLKKDVIYKDDSDNYHIV